MSKTKTSGMNKNQAKAVVAVLLSAVLLVGGGAVGYGMATDWTYQKATQIEQPEDEQNGAVITPAEENGIKLMTARISAENYAAYGVSPLAETAYTLTAIVMPESTTYKEVDYTAEWADASSDWATGKNVADYVKVTQDVDGSLTAKVEVLQAFSEQVIVTATLRRNTEIKSTCTVDYVATYDIELHNTVMSNLSSNIGLDLNNVVGTLAFETEDLLNVTMYVPSEVYTGLQARGVEVNDDNFSFTLTPFEQGNTGDFLGGFTTGPSYSMNKFFEMYYEQQVTGIEYEEFFTILSDVYLDGRAPADCSGDEIFQIEIFTERMYNGQSYGRVDLDSTSITLTDWSGFEVSATGMSLNQSSIIAG